MFTLSERRELLTDFAEFAGVARGRPDADSARERIVDRYIIERQGGALGFTDDELKGTARDTHTPTEPLSGGPDLG